MSTRIKDLTEDTTPVAGDSVPIDSTGDGTRRSLLSSIAALFATLLGGLGLESDGGSPAKLRVKAQLLDYSTTGGNIFDAAASSTFSEKIVYQNRTGVTLAIAAVLYADRLTIAGNDTNNFVLNVFIRTPAAVQTTVVTFTNNVAGGGITAFVPKNLGALTDTTLADGDALYQSTTKNGSGQAMAGSIIVDMDLPG